MPRRRPGHVRTGLCGHRQTPGANPVIDGLSSHALSEIHRLERTRNYLHPGDVGAAVRLWKEYARRPQRELWHDYERGNVHWYCCGNPLQARALLETVTQAVSPRTARELRRIISRADGLWNPSRPFDTDRGGKDGLSAGPGPCGR
ncbi:hypothetical protein WN71_020655 [Streptomyces mangrovisoli]|uniref:Uncharacterized protein n=1 Tax=Streptomyces mangrovisoli TaxID=1428628 RepID=A0A1J4NUU5_9ACTN|nr:hypothetical protein WN71_020655 [Streptomyces mangrovisoli]